MFGKLSSIVNYMKCLEVYTVKRYPSTKLPLIGLVTTYFVAMMISRTYVIRQAENDWKNLFGKKEGRIGQWKF
jgi:hypothetical protein